VHAPKVHEPDAIWFSPADSCTPPCDATRLRVAQPQRGARCAHTLAGAHHHHHINVNAFAQMCMRALDMLYIANVTSTYTGSWSADGLPAPISLAPRRSGETIDGRGQPLSFTLSFGEIPWFDEKGGNTAL
jgi:hypothetical protein